MTVYSLVIFKPKAAKLSSEVMEIRSRPKCSALGLGCTIKPCTDAVKTSNLRRGWGWTCTTRTADTRCQQSTTPIKRARTYFSRQSAWRGLGWRWWNIPVWYQKTGISKNTNPTETTWKKKVEHTLYLRGRDGDPSRTPLLTGETSKKLLLPARGEDVPSLRPIRLSLGGGSGLGGGGPGDACLVGLGGGILLGLVGKLLTGLLLPPPRLNFKIDVNLFLPRFEDSSTFKLSDGSLETCMGLDCDWE